MADLEAGANVLNKKTAPVVHSITGVAPVQVTQVAGSPGHFTVGLGVGSGILASGEVTELEPINALFEYKDLQGYFKLADSSNVPFGLRGQIILPRGTPTAGTLNLYLQLVSGATVSVGGGNLGLDVRYQVWPAINSPSRGALPTGIGALRTAGTQLVSIPANTPAYTLCVGKALTVSRELVYADSVVGFELMRNRAVAGNIPAMLGVVGAYWTIESV